MQDLFSSIFHLTELDNSHSKFSNFSCDKIHNYFSEYKIYFSTIKQFLITVHNFDYRNILICLYKR